ncbi:hypothetical protein, conserved [Trypanosoma brucei brucei TREU927]|uniref:Mitochondrial SSU ribosomal protein n=1 Tax=Trypanosoma brucei brucei (strain 927/4 GUTat10.1) TaxID=185431 RepID=Q386Q7_TRYB2|nr:hypothetical protein, conserved [Trypanosoma brucei brucei TREU927]EAN79224.1 hypothetical protein, conserved [Trypanosoma brucei brucei TREU927]6SG9_DE Chain DE, mS52 [Trypanosoma brucei brucei]6SGB_DE Chain DE, mS52 [Trypanosoma brucei brucei]
MRRCSFASTCRYRSADDVPLGLGSAYVWTCRNITSRGQFNPIHNFSYAMERGVRARDVKAFEKLITNPGPLRVAYTPDYLDWLHRCYKAKGTYMDARAVAEKKFNGNIVSSELSAAVNRREGKRGDTRGDTVDNDHHNLPGAPPPGMFLRPAHSFRRLAGELKRRRAQSILDEVARAQGMLDLFERQPHFPAIHIDRCSRFHLVELFKEMVLERSLDSNMIWEKALLYRAILSERKPSYPTSFHYIFTAVEDTVFAPTISTPMEMAGSGGEGHDRSSHPLAAKCPTLEAYYYYVYLVKKYYIDNAVEAHVVLRCHREPNAADLLFSNPPPKDDTEIMKAVELLRNADIQRGVAAAAAVSDPTLPPGGEGSVIGNSDNKKNSEKTSEGSRGRPARPPVLPGAYPPIDMLWRCEENLPLLKVLLFGEFNLIVSENPFVKFPSAHGFLTRPYSTDSSRTLADGMSLANVMAEKRGHLLPSLPRNTATSIDARAQDIRRLQQKHHRDDIVSFQKLLRSTHAEDSPSAFSSYSDWSYFNPRAVRAEERDRLTRKAVEALKLYDSATNDIYRHSFEDVQACHTQRVTERDRTMPPYLPTLPHFVAIIKKDPHISFLLHIGLPDRNSSEEGSAKHKELEKRIYYLARALYHTALEYHNETVRRVNRQKVNVAASLLDNFVEQEWTTILRDKHDVTDVTKTLNDTQNDKKQLARRLGRYMLFANRSLDDTGFPTDARADDYTRWMAPPSVGKVSL